MNPRLLMCSPEYFGVNYVINPWMANQVGKTDANQALREWNDFRKSLSRHADVSLIEPHPELPDLVFTANAGLLLGKTFIPSRFIHPERRSEEPVFKDWFRSHGYRILELPGKIAFEGAGDTLLHPELNILWAGYGFRTDRSALNGIGETLEEKIVPLCLADARFYHLDTCLCPLLDGQLMYYPQAFDAESLDRIKDNVAPENRVEVSDEDAQAFACNAVLLDDVLFMNQASQVLRETLQRKGYRIQIQPVAEFLKSGGANKCLTMRLGEFLH